MESPRLFDQVRDAIRVRHYSLRTEASYIQWIKRFILFHNKRHPRDMGEQEITAFLTHLAVSKNVAASTQNQALAAILFLYKEVLHRELDWMDNITRAKRSVHVPEVLSPEQVRRLLDRLEGVYQLVARLLCMARACGSWRVCACACRTWIFTIVKSRCATGRAARIVSRCCRIH